MAGAASQAGRATNAFCAKGMQDPHLSSPRLICILDYQALLPLFSQSFRIVEVIYLRALQLEAAAAEVLQTLRTKPAGEEGEADQPNRREVQVLLTSQENPISPRQLTVSGLVVSSQAGSEIISNLGSTKKPGARCPIEKFNLSGEGTVLSILMHLLSRLDVLCLQDDADEQPFNDNEKS